MSLLRKCRLCIHRPRCSLAPSLLLTFELAQMQTAWPLLDTTNVCNEIATLLYALTKQRFPLVGQLAHLPRPRLSAL